MSEKLNPHLLAGLLQVVNALGVVLLGSCAHEHPGCVTILSDDS